MAKRRRTTKRGSAKLGLPAGTVALAGYDPEWSHLFEEEKAVLLGAVGGQVLEIEHIGSTAVPGLAAKPILDIAVAIETLGLVQSLVGPLAGLGYEHKGEYGLPGRHFFTRGSPVTHHVHVVEKSSGHWRVWRQFRDYMRAHPDEAARYAAFKKGLAEKFHHDRDAYTRSKSEYVEAILRKAREEAGP